LTDLIGITIHAWWRVPGAWSIVVPDQTADRPLAVLAIRLTIAKSANAVSSLAILCWRGVVASVIGAKTLAILAKLSAVLSRS
jgi:hypothetical protein